jgi:hypothetical protein
MDMWAVLIGAAPGVAALVWRGTQRILDGCRVRVEIVTAYAGNDLPPSVINDKGQFNPTWAWDLVTSRQAVPVSVVRVQVRGRLAVSIESIGAATADGRDPLAHTDVPRPGVSAPY